VRLSEVLELGVHRDTLRAMRDPLVTNPDFLQALL
jgi:hypothetical protein